MDDVEEAAAAEEVLAGLAEDASPEEIVQALRPYRQSAVAAALQGRVAGGVGGGSQPEGAVWVYPFADAASADDQLGEDGDLCVLLDTLEIIQKESGTWAIV